MKKIILVLTSLSFICSPILRADSAVLPQEECPASYEEEEEEALPPGKMVGKASDDARSEAKRRRMRNWGLAAGVVAIGIVTLVLVSHNHRK